ncbi:hypothetical protein [Streptomyces sp. MAR4 CNX-425]|uniref:hypothetical protein n=1 Tax=Streptomyces sp. MAR4 CNX-425 TaxID=3406343 RepID=UPI003B50F975
MRTRYEGRSPPSSAPIAPAHGTREDHLVELLLWPADGHYWLAVSDPGPGTPAPAPVAPDADACGGRGLRLVDSLAAAWAVVPRHACGKAVVAGLRLHAR